MKHSDYFDGMTRSDTRSRRIVMIFGNTLLAGALIFCGCVSRPPLNEKTFAFGTPVLRATNGVAGNHVLGIRTLQIAAPFDGRSLVYRTGEFSYERDPYAVFLGSPTEGLAAPVCGLLREDGCFNAVVGPGNSSALKADTLVEISINQLYGDIRKPGSPSAVLAIQMIFFEATNGLPGKVILQRDYSRTIPMRSATAAALMEGWNQALVGIFTEASSDFQRQAVKGHDKHANDSE